MSVDYVSIARERRLAALDIIGRRQIYIPGMPNVKMAPVSIDGNVVPIREPIVYFLDPNDARNESVQVLPPRK